MEIKDSAPKPIVMGRHLLELGLKPSKKMGQILDALYEAQLDGEFSDLRGGIERLHKMLEIDGSV